MFIYLVITVKAIVFVAVENDLYHILSCSASDVAQQVSHTFEPKGNTCFLIVKAYKK